MEQQRRKEEEEAEASLKSGGSGGGTYSLGATILASRFAANALRGVHRNRLSRGTSVLVKPPKPPEPDFSADAD